MAKDKSNYSPKEYKHYDKQTVSKIDYLIDQKKYDDALELALNYAKEYPNDDFAPYAVAKVYTCMGEYQKAYDYLGSDYEHRRFYNKSAKHRALIIYVHVLEGCGEINKAISLLSDAISEDPEYLNIKIRMDYLKLLLSISKYDEVIINANIYLRRKNHPAFFEFKAKALMTLGKSGQALEAFMNAELYDVGNANVQGRRYYIGRCNYDLFLKRNDYSFLKEAEEYFKKALTNEGPFYYLACNSLANIYNNLEKPEEAIKYASLVIENGQILKNPIKVDESRRSIAYAYLFQGKNDLALDIINQMDNSYIKESTLVRYFFFTKQYDEFLKHINWVLSEASDAGFKTHIQEYIGVLVNLGKYDEALNIINWVKDDLTQSFYERSIAFIKKQKGEEHEIYRYYTARQIANYSFEEAVNHILIGHVDNTQDQAYFKSEKEVIEALYEAQELIKDMDSIPNLLVDKYTLVKEGAGQDKFGKVNGLVVIAIAGTNNIITLYPISSRCLSDYEDEYQSKNVKRLSQIEKFNQKYGKK